MSLTVQMPGGTNKTFGSMTADLDAALKAGARPVAPDGHAYAVQSFMGGWLLDQCPLNVIFGLGWLPGQQDALRAAGLTACVGGAVVGAMNTAGSACNVGGLTGAWTWTNGVLTCVPISGTGAINTTGLTNTTISALAPSLTPGSGGSIPVGDPGLPALPIPVPVSSNVPLLIGAALLLWFLSGR